MSDSDHILDDPDAYRRMVTELEKVVNESDRDNDLPAIRLLARAVALARELRPTVGSTLKAVPNVRIGGRPAATLRDD